MTLRHSNRAKRTAVPLAERTGALRRRRLSSRPGLPGGPLAGSLGLLLLCKLCCANGAWAADPLDLSYPSEVARLREGVESLRREVAELRDENSRLKRQHESLLTENQSLQRVLAQSETAARPARARTNAPAPAHQSPNPVAVPTGTNLPNRAESRVRTHWLSTADGKRHTNRCRFYKRTVGRPCEETEGGLCVFCGE